jgi:hypothetical protein
MVRCFVVLSVLMGCSEESGPKEKDSTTAPGSGTPTPGLTSSSIPPTGTGTTTSTATETVTFDCSTMPDMPLAEIPLDAPRGYNDLVFDLNGEMIGHDSSTDVFMRATDEYTAVVHATENSTVYKMGMLSTGDFVANTNNAGLILVTPAGAVSTLNQNVSGYGLAIFPDDSIYVATNYTVGADSIVRVDPVTGDYEILEELPVTPRAIAFSRDFDVLYIGTTDNGLVYRLPLDANGDPTESASLLVNVPAAWHDTLEVDACGNVYVGSVFSASIFRVNADLSVDEVLAWGGGFGGPYGHGLEWGDAKGGWNEMSAYVTQPYIGSRVTEYDLGVPGQAWPGTVIGGTTL